MLAQLCQEHTARLMAWRAGQTVAVEKPDAVVPPSPTRYDGTVLSACRIYQEHPYSPFHGVKHNTRRTYEKDLRRIEQTVGQRRLRNVTVVDVKHWYQQWRKPEVDGGPERIDRAHDSVSMFKTVIYFMASLRNPECKMLASEIERVKFEKGGARQEELTYKHAAAFIRTALDLGKSGAIPVERGLMMSIGVAAQFELMLRQMDVIGEWAPIGAARKLPDGIAVLDLPATAPTERWAGFFTWEHIPGWRWRTKTSKSKYRAGVEFDLTSFSLLHPLLEAVPHDQRAGAIVKGERGLPIRARSYGNWFRDIARAAGIPDVVWSMDARAGGATEADEAGVTLEAIQGAMTHTNKVTTLRYLRGARTKKLSAIAEARTIKRAADSDGGGDATG
jgi:hypothetical protein